MRAKKLKINTIDLDSLKENPVISLDKSTDYTLEFVSKHIVEHISVTDIKGKAIHESGINGTHFIFNYRHGCKDMVLLRIQKQKDETRILIL